MTDQKLYTKGARVWLKDPDQVWKAAVVTQDYDGTSGQLHVETENEVEPIVLEIGQSKGQTELPPLRNPDILIGENDLTSLSYLHEPAVLHNLAVRFIDNHAIYTYCGIVLVAINPYEELPIYGNDTIGMYRGKNMGELDPHIYAVAEEAFTKMERENRNQSIIVSGESGAGKTVSAKYAMRYFATVGGTSETETQVEKRVLASSPIMEAIGNAKTTRNDNSSRFGKYIEIDFNKHFHIIGASMRTYLLEKSRVVFQASEERNYHIFYQMCAAKDLDELKHLYLESPMDFFYTSQGQDPEIDGVDDRKEFLATKEAFKLLGFSAKEQANIFKILAGILHLGNVVFEAGSGKMDSESCSISSEDQSLIWFAELFDIEADQIRKWLCNRKIVTARESYTKPIGAGDARFARDALSKYIYSKIFDWIVVKINKALKTSGKVHKFIGVLDIYGFETFDTNSFEQFCINYANEKLQQQFNQHVFKLEQDEYLKEGIEWKMIDFYDNQPCIDLIEIKLGILDLLDEECRMPKGTDKSWVEKLYDKCSKIQHFAKPRLSQTAFIVKHFADDVEYECAGFLDKNRDTVNEEQINILKASGNDLVSDLFLEIHAVETNKTPGKSSTKGSSAKSHKKTVGSQFRDSLNLLMSALNSTTPHYVRCIKPNDEKAAFEFDPKRGVQQLRACGVLETVRISAAGYPSRWTYYDFFLRYRVLCHSSDVKKADSRTTCENIIKKLITDEDKYQFGKTKLFFRAGQVAYMEKLRADKLRHCGIMIQKHVKGWLYRKRFMAKKNSTQTLQRWVRGFLARRRVHHIRRTKAAITLQKHVRRWVKQTQYQRQKDRTVRLQARVRGIQARLRHVQLVRQSKALIIQTRVRGFLARRRYQKAIRNVILVQCQIRKFLAKKTFKKLKLEARSVAHQKKLNQGLENKIITLQQKLTESNKANKEVKQLRTDKEALAKEVQTLKESVSQGKAAMTKVQKLEEQVRVLTEKLEEEKMEKVDVITQRKLELDSWSEKEANYDEVIEDFKKKLSKAEEEYQTKGEEVNAELVRNLENERDSLKNECDQERIAYQKLLKAYNKLEAQYENAQDELQSLKHPNGEAFDSMSFASMSINEEESAYGGSQSMGSVRSSAEPPTRNNDVEIDVGLTVRLQHKLKETQLAKDKLERKLEHLEMKSLGADYQPDPARRNYESIKLNEMEIENEKLREDIKRLRVNNNSNDQMKELSEQFETLQEELDRRREETIQLRTVLANVSLDHEPLSLSKSGELPEAEEIMAAYETQKVVIAQLQEQLNDEKLRNTEIEGDLRDEIDRLSKTCSDQQQLIHQAINKAPANTTEACLQHEITRLTSENFDLREKIENLNDNIRRLKKMLKTYMKRLEDSGVHPNEATHEINDNYEHVEQSIVIRMKDHDDYLGMFEYKKDLEQKIFKAMIYDLKPKVALQMLPGLPAYILFMMVRFTDHQNNDVMVRSLIQGAIGTIKRAVKKKGANDIDMKVLWLSNLLRFLSNMEQYSGEAQFVKFCSQKQAEQSLRNFDLSEYRRVINDVAIWIYSGVTKLMEEELQPLLVPAIIEHQGISGLGAADGKAQKSHSSSEGIYVDPAEALDKLLHLLNRFNSCFQKHGLDPQLISRIFREAFYFICAGSLNNILLRKDMCHWSKGMQIRYNVAQVEQWARDIKIDDKERDLKATDTLEPIVQAATLLQANKTEDNVSNISDNCKALKVSQIIKLLNSYTPLDEMEERVTPAFVRKIQAKLAERAQNENNQELLMPSRMNGAIKFPFCASNIALEEVEIPDVYNGLNAMLRKM